MADRRQLVEELRKSFGSVKRCMAFRHTSDIGLNRAQLEVLFYLNCNQDQSASIKDLMRVTGTTSSAVTQLVETLERHGYVERRNSPDDRRVVLVHFTGQGREKLDTLHHNLTDMLLQLTEPLTDDELKTLVTLHQKIARQTNDL